MSRILLIILTILLFGCSDKGEIVEGERVDVTINLSSLKRETMRSAESEPFAIPADHKIRYIVEVYTQGVIYWRAVDYNPSIALSLVANQTYDFLFWADYVPVGSTDKSDHHYATKSGLKAVSIKGSTYIGSDETRDAFCGRIRAMEVNSSFSLSPILSRPFAKLELYNTVPLTASPTVTVDYGTQLKNGYDVSTGVATQLDSGVKASYPDPKIGDMLLGFDYLFVTKEGELPFTITLKIGEISKGISVPLGANRITKVTGVFLQ